MFAEVSFKKPFYTVVTPFVCVKKIIIMHCCMSRKTAPLIETIGESLNPNSKLPIYMNFEMPILAPIEMAITDRYLLCFHL